MRGRNRTAARVESPKQPLAVRFRAATAGSGFRRWPLAAALVLAASLTAAEIPAHPKDLKFEPIHYQPPKASQYRHVLSNGAAAYIVEDHLLPLFSVSVLVRTGQYLDPPDKTGLASLTGGQMRSGGTAALSAQDFDEEADFLAATIISNIGDTQGAANLTGLTRNLDASLKLLFDMLKSPRFDQQRLDIAKARILQALARRNDRTDEIEMREYGRLLRGGNHFSTAQDTKASIESITRDDLIAFHKKYYHPANFIFAVSGDIDTKQMIAKLEQLTSGWGGPKPDVPKVPKPDYTPVPGLYAIDKSDVNQCRVSIGHLAVTRDNPDHYALSVMNEILGGGSFTSRIMSRVRADEGLAYDAHSAMTFGVYYEGVFRSAFQSKSPSCAQAASIVMEEIDRIRKEKIRPEELATAVNYQIEIFPRFFATASQVASTLANDEYTNRPANYWETYRDRLRAITADDVQRVAQKYLHTDQLVILAVGNLNDVLKGDPNRPQFSFDKIAGTGGIRRLPLPDPVTMVYPK